MSDELISLLKDCKKIILVHGNADPDALGSAYAIARMLPPADIHAPDGLDRSGRALQKSLNIELVDRFCPEEYELTVIVDTSSMEQLQGVSKIPAGSMIIDHHHPSDRWLGMIYYCDDSKVSCAEIIAEMLDEAGVGTDRESAIALMVGMLTDSGHFQYGNPSLLRRFASLMEEHNISMDEILAITRADTGISERAAVLKGMQRSRFDRVGNFIVATSYGSSYEASISRALLNAGADVAFVGSQREDRFRLSARCTQEMVRRGLHLGSLLDELGGETDSEGGGHGGAAGMTGVGDVEAILHMCMQKTMSFFREIRDSAT
ncbi:MAG: hypothetical protein PWQ62_609 [Candidatus Methanomethylophilaceae archaeon]|nr:hypothetical protein [Candidatus Methanomethylophilaceae archaeon]